MKAKTTEPIESKGLVSAIILAAGSGTRFSSDCTKQLTDIQGVPVLARSASAFQQLEEIQEIVIVSRRDEIAAVKKMCREHKITKLSAVIEGGSTRQESSLAGVLAANAAAKYVAIHDAARCLVTPEMIQNTLSAARQQGAATAACRCVDTMKIANTEGLIERTMDRDFVWRVFTPQIFEKNLYLAAAEKAQAEGFAVTDDCSLVEYLGGRIKLVDVGDENIKLTHSSDRFLAEFILKKREDRL